jgi:hypothetical protein
VIQPLATDRSICSFIAANLFPYTGNGLITAADIVSVDVAAGVEPIMMTVRLTVSGSLPMVGRASGGAVVVTVVFVVLTVCAGINAVGAKHDGATTVEVGAITADVGATITFEAGTICIVWAGSIYVVVFVMQSAFAGNSDAMPLTIDSIITMLRLVLIGPHLLLSFVGKLTKSF